MRISTGRDLDNKNLYELSIKVWEIIRKIIISEMLKINTMGGVYGVIDAWCLLAIQYYLCKYKDLDLSSDFTRTLDFEDFRKLLINGNFNKHKRIKDKFHHLKEKFIHQKVFLFKRELYDEKYILEAISGEKFLNIFTINLKISRGTDHENNLKLKGLNRKLKTSLRNKFKNIKTENLSKFLVMTMPEIYLKNQSEIYINGIEKIIKQKPKTFIRVSKSIIDDDLLKLLGAKLKENGVNLKTIVHGGNNDEIAYNSTYKLDEELSEKNIKAGDITVKCNLSRYKSNNKNIKKGITFYLMPRWFENYWMMGSETLEDYPKYMADIIDVISKLNKEVKQELLIMRNDDADKVNLNELKLHINSSQILGYNSIKKRIFRKIFTPKLQIATYTGSVMVESIKSNIPCLIYINPKRYELSHNMENAMEILLESKILHKETKSLINFLNADIDYNKWWNTPKTIKAKKVYTALMKTCF